ncbi:nuclear transport factor 2 family protein [Massilia horti]|uniref:Nuclear transport factor 2 family protein n=1 Tax=Massilia horti TaxID=2562153 RepID=A0A4Y9T4W8_9BURK|nr:nuclear transport factor 2 family protein [Massilia horti]TFW34818.1 nuclear transport factor 2 family protein [Massilia horti]
MTWALKKYGSILAVAALSFCLGHPAFAGPLDEAKAQAHLNAVAAGDLDALMRDYTDDAYMEWVGGPLDGRYRGKAAIRAVWEKFIAANAGKPRPANVGKLSAFANPRGTSLQAKAEYGGALPLKVLHVLTYREGELTTELWQIAPALQIDQ